ncbi:fimbrial isopeptide formation D2 family protein/LPXTG-motif cell wall-anchored protein [Leucobacter exalbidus]|uniref:Fimbrial isopeptide formation D2 family protein/LPXTG-motif cell wall-anchored protein n=1 Tax=Leucobacter exalbidus TaxID=662960 RepID=A0A940T4D0_9MICO|nr:SpaH/EbpB family LPXTG-anchored major pilin [Leucobacter exalbidus]MBP1327107.1 fimbrial isopeptide formation D2 family protein/LPXTG-motif cell wall-anchored protein [Leucobacter exalbidus]
MTQHKGGGMARRALAIFGAAALATLGVFAGGSAAHAAEPLPGNIEGSSGSLTIHKHTGTPGDVGNGQELADASTIAGLGVGLEGVTFSVERVAFDGAAIDLSTAAGWDQAEGATPANAATAPYSLPAADAQSVTTGADGTVKLSDLAYGLYLVTETGAGANPIVGAVEPFLVSVPYPNAETSSWNYDVHVYPKNLLADNPTKEVSSEGAIKQGDVVTWTITVPVPRPAEGNVYTNFSITDDLDPLLTLTGVSVSLDGTTLTEGTDYVATPATLPAADGPLVTVTPNLANVQTGQTYVVTLTTEVTGAGEIVNYALRNTNGVEKEIGPAQTNWGKVQLVKENQSGATLQGAKFELWNADKTEIVLAEQTTDASGVINFDAVWVGNDADKTETYCLKETAAPAGYVLPNDPWTCVEVTSNATGIAVGQRVINTQQVGPQLPLTGSNGSTIAMAGGIALVLIAGGATLVGARRKSRAAK